MVKTRKRGTRKPVKSHARTARPKATANDTSEVTAQQDDNTGRDPDKQEQNQDVQLGRVEALDERESGTADSDRLTLKNEKERLESYDEQNYEEHVENENEEDGNKEKEAESVGEGGSVRSTRKGGQKSRIRKREELDCTVTKTNESEVSATVISKPSVGKCADSTGISTRSGRRKSNILPGEDKDEEIAETVKTASVDMKVEVRQESQSNDAETRSTRSKRRKKNEDSEPSSSVKEKTADVKEEKEARTFRSTRSRKRKIPEEGSETDKQGKEENDGLEEAPGTESCTHTESNNQTESGKETEGSETIDIIQTECGIETESSKQSECGIEMESSKQSQCGIETESSKQSECGIETESSKQSECGIESESSKQSECGIETESSKQTETKQQAGSNQQSENRYSKSKSEMKKERIKRKRNTQSVNINTDTALCSKKIKLEVESVNEDSNEHEERHNTETAYAQVLAIPIKQERSAEDFDSTEQMENESENLDMRREIMAREESNDSSPIDQVSQFGEDNKSDGIPSVEGFEQNNIAQEETMQYNPQDDKDARKTAKSQVIDGVATSIDHPPMFDNCDILQSPMIQAKLAAEAEIRKLMDLQESQPIDFGAKHIAGMKVNLGYDTGDFERDIFLFSGPLENASPPSQPEQPGTVDRNVMHEYARQLRECKLCRVKFSDEESAFAHFHVSMTYLNPEKRAHVERFLYGQMMLGFEEFAHRYPPAECPLYLYWEGFGDLPDYNRSLIPEDHALFIYRCGMYLKNFCQPCVQKHTNAAVKSLKTPAQRWMEHCLSPGHQQMFIELVADMKNHAVIPAMRIYCFPLLDWISKRRRATLQALQSINKYTRSSTCVKTLPLTVYDLTKQYHPRDILTSWPENQRAVLRKVQQMIKDMVAVKNPDLTPIVFSRLQLGPCRRLKKKDVLLEGNVLASSVPQKFLYPVPEEVEFRQLFEAEHHGLMECPSQDNNTACWFATNLASCDLCQVDLHQGLEAFRHFNQTVTAEHCQDSNQHYVNYLKTLSTMGPKDFYEKYPRQKCPIFIHSTVDDGLSDALPNSTLDHDTALFLHRIGLVTQYKCKLCNGELKQEEGLSYARRWIEHCCSKTHIMNFVSASQSQSYSSFVKQSSDLFVIPPSSVLDDNKEAIFMGLQKIVTSQQVNQPLPNDTGSQGQQKQSMSFHSSSVKTIHPCADSTVNAQPPTKVQEPSVNQQQQEKQDSSHNDGKIHGSSISLLSAAHTLPHATWTLEQEENLMALHNNITKKTGFCAHKQCNYKSADLKDPVYFKEHWRKSHMAHHIKLKLTCPQCNTDQAGSDPYLLHLMYNCTIGCCSQADAVSTLRKKYDTWSQPPERVIVGEISPRKWLCSQDEATKGEETSGIMSPVETDCDSAATMPPVETECNSAAIAPPVETDGDSAAIMPPVDSAGLPYDTWTLAEEKCIMDVYNSRVKERQKCPKCREHNMRNAVMFKMHWRTTHMSRGNMLKNICPTCNESFKTSGALVKHVLLNPLKRDKQYSSHESQRELENVFNKILRQWADPPRKVVIGGETGNLFYPYQPRVRIRHRFNSSRKASVASTSIMEVSMEKQTKIQHLPKIGQIQQEREIGQIQQEREAEMKIGQEQQQKQMEDKEKKEPAIFGMKAVYTETSLPYETWTLAQETNIMVVHEQVSRDKGKCVKCSFSHKEMRNAMMFKEHWRMNHMSEGSMLRIRCPACQKMFPNTVTLVQHLTLKRLRCKMGLHYNDISQAVKVVNQFLYRWADPPRKVVKGGKTGNSTYPLCPTIVSPGAVAFTSSKKMSREEQEQTETQQQQEVAMWKGGQEQKIMEEKKDEPHRKELEQGKVKQVKDMHQAEPNEPNILTFKHFELLPGGLPFDTWTQAQEQNIMSMHIELVKTTYRCGKCRYIDEAIRNPVVFKEHWREQHMLEKEKCNLYCLPCNRRFRSAKLLVEHRTTECDFPCSFQVAGKDVNQILHNWADPPKKIIIGGATDIALYPFCPTIGASVTPSHHTEVMSKTSSDTIVTSPLTMEPRLSRRKQRKHNAYAMRIMQNKAKKMSTGTTSFMPHPNVQQPAGQEFSELPRHLLGHASEAHYMQPMFGQQYGQVPMVRPLMAVERSDGFPHPMAEQHLPGAGIQMTSWQSQQAIPWQHTASQVTQQSTYRGQGVLQQARPQQTFIQQGPRGHAFIQQGPQEQAFIQQGPRGQAFIPQGPRGQAFTQQGPQGQAFIQQGPQGQAFTQQGPQEQAFTQQGPQEQAFIQQGQMGLSTNIRQTVTQQQPVNKGQGIMHQANAMQQTVQETVLTEQIHTRQMVTTQAAVNVRQGVTQQTAMNVGQGVTQAAVNVGQGVTQAAMKIGQGVTPQAARNVGQGVTQTARNFGQGVTQQTALNVGQGVTQQATDMGQVKSDQRSTDNVPNVSAASGGKAISVLTTVAHTVVTIISPKSAPVKAVSVFTNMCLAASGQRQKEQEQLKQQSQEQQQKLMPLETQGEIKQTAETSHKRRWDNMVSSSPSPSTSASSSATNKPAFWKKQAFETLRLFGSKKGKSQQGVEKRLTLGEKAAQEAMAAVKEQEAVKRRKLEHMQKQTPATPVKPKVPLNKESRELLRQVSVNVLYVLSEHEIYMKERISTLNRDQYKVLLHIKQHAGKASLATCLQIIKVLMERSTEDLDTLSSMDLDVMLKKLESSSSGGIGQVIPMLQYLMQIRQAFQNFF